MEDKKELILNEVGKLYLKHGVKSVTMDDVAHELSLSKKTIYRYFTDKKDLVSQVIDTFFLKNPHFRLTEAKGVNAIDRILNIRKHMVKVFQLIQNNLEYDLKKTYPCVHKKVIDFKRKKIYEDNFSATEQGKKEGLFRNELDSDFIAKLIVGRFLLIFNPDNGIFTSSDLINIKLFDQAIDYHFHAICTEKGLKYYKQQLNKVQNEN